ncbi:MAG: energy-coupling factor transporter transmembrane protein EcfT [Anaerolineae bacterium]|nr:energy-coupling factor transporter transmembrane protein EcfT [Anaerolineae bacterium]
MTVTFDTYVPGSSLLHRLDPRAKLWATLLSLMAVFLLPNVGAQLLFLAGIHLVLLASGVPWRTLWGLWRQMAILVILIMVLQPFLRPIGREVFSLGPLHLTTGGMLDAVRLALRALAIAFAVATLLYTTSQPALVSAMVRLGLPYTWGLTVSLALRFLPAIQDLFHTVRDAQAARGWIAEGSIFRRLQEHVPILVAVMIGTLRMSDQLTLALAARGLETSRRRTTWHALHMRRRDWAFALGITLAFCLFAWWQLRS